MANPTPSATVHEPLRAFFTGLAEGKHAPRIPAGLRALADRAARQLDRCPATGDDLLAELLADICGASAEDRRLACAELAAYAEDALRGILAYRLRQRALQALPTRKLWRRLHDHARAALEAGAAPAPVPMPPTLRQGDRIDGALVHRAVCALLHDRAHVARSAGALASELMDAYFRPEAEEDAVEGAWAPPPPDRLVEARREVALLRAALARAVEAGELRLLARRLAGARLETLAEEAGVSVSTAHARLERACGRVKGVVRARGASPQELVLALQAA
jgi:hypothetical protein